MNALLDAASLAQLTGASHDTSLRLANGLVAARCGRNEVWRIETGDQGTMYVKIHRDDEAFERERFGLALAAAIAAADDRFDAARCLQIDRSLGVLITAELPGTPVSELIRDAYRIDRNPLRRSAPRRLAEKAVHAVLCWIEAFHRQSAAAAPRLHDHSRTGIIERVNRKLQQPCGNNTFARAVAVSAFSLPPAQHAPATLTMQFGDPSLENFRFDGQRIGAVDFEDVGVGIGERDSIILRNRLARALALPYYFSDSSLVASIPAASSLDEAIVQIELELLRYERETLSPGPTRTWRLARQARRLRRAVARCPELVAGTDR